MYINCWQCKEQIDAISAEKYVYRNVIRQMDPANALTVAIELLERLSKDSS